MRLGPGLALVITAAAAPAQPAPSPPPPVKLDLGVLVGDHGWWPGGRDRLKVEARGLDVRFTVPRAALQSPRPSLDVNTYTDGKEGAPAPVRVRVFEEPANKLVGQSDTTCFDGLNAPTCWLPIHLGAKALTYRVELRADHPLVVNLGVLAFEPYER